MDRTVSRRHALIALGSSAIVSSSTLASSSEVVSLVPDTNHGLYRVRMTLDVEGNIEVPRNALADDKVHKMGIQAKSVIDYEERLTRDANGTAQAARRYYYEAGTKSTIQKNDIESGLRPEARRVIAQLDGSRTVVYGERSQLSDEELQLLRVPINSLAIDRILPSKSVKIDESWQIPADVLATLFDLDGVQKTTASAWVASADKNVANLEISGQLTAAVDGVPTTIDVRAKAIFDRKLGSITWFASAMREDRDIGNAEPGFVISAKVGVIRQVLKKPNAVRDTTAVDIAGQPSEDKLMVELQGKRGGFQVNCDRRWRVIQSNDRFTTIRMIDNDHIIAQCDVRNMPDLKDGHQLTLEAFEEDIKRTIGDRLEELIEAEEKLTGYGIRLMRVVAQGTVQNIPVQWIYLHFSNDENRRCAAIFTIANKQIEAFAGSDLQFAEGFEFTDLPKSDDVASADVSVLTNDGTSDAKVASNPETSDSKVSRRK